MTGEQEVNDREDFRGTIRWIKGVLILRVGLLFTLSGWGISVENKHMYKGESGPSTISQ